MIINDDSLHALKNLADNSIDAVITDPPYGYSFMGKDWDKAVPSVEIWQECLRVLKPGAFACVMSAPRSDVQQAMTERLIKAGFRLDFTPIYWTYASGFPKAGNIGKLVDKRLGTYVAGDVLPSSRKVEHSGDDADFTSYSIKTAPNPQSEEARALDGSYAGFQPKPAVEVVIVAMKPLSQKTYVDQALTNRKGITWLDDCRVPGEERTTSFMSANSADAFNRDDNWQPKQGTTTVSGRFPANLLVSDDALQAHSKYFDLDAWADTLPFLAVPKASKSEKNAGLELLEARQSGSFDGNVDLTKARKIGANPDRPNQPTKNHHPTVKPLKLMSYLITLTTREGDTVLDPFVGSGTTVVAAKQLNRDGIGIEREPEYAEIARARLAHISPQTAEETPTKTTASDILKPVQANLFEDPIDA